jgi:hypothetical protein
MMDNILGSSRQMVPIGDYNVVLKKLPDEDLAPKNTSYVAPAVPQEESSTMPVQKKTTEDYIFQFYLGSITVVGLFILFRMIQKSK